MRATPQRLKLFSTAPQSRGAERSQYAGAVGDAARLAEAAGCEGMLVYTDNAILDPWLVSQLILDATERLCPLVAVQPAYMHPYSVAKLLATFAYLRERRCYVNLVAGGFRNDLIALGDDTPHDDRYGRALEYGQIIRALVEGAAAVTLEGRYYRVRNLRLTPTIPPELAPGMTISGSSPAGLAAARALGAVAVKYPEPAVAEQPIDPQIEAGLRIGIIARDDAEEAWRVAYGRFPEDRAGQIAHGLAMRVSDSEWHRQLSELAHAAAASGAAYWLGPFQNYKTFCPYLVGDHPSVAAELARYLELGFSTFILDIPSGEADLEHTAAVFDEAMSGRRS